MSESLFNLFRELCEHHVYVTDLHGFNLMYDRNRGLWMIIDTNGFRQNEADPYSAFYNDLLAHWRDEFENPEYDEEIQTRLRRIEPILLNRLRDHRPSMAL